MNKLQTLLETATDADKVELKILHNASVACLRAYNEQPTAAKMKDTEAARAGLDQAVERLWAIYFPEEKRFKNALAAHKWLQAKHFKVGRAKFYKDLKEQKKIRQETDGSILKSSLELYAGTLKFLGDPADVLHDWQSKEARLKVEKLETENKLKAIELQQKTGEVVSRREADLMRASLITALNSSLENAYVTRAAALVEVVAGDQTLARALMAALLDIKNDAFRALADMGEFHIDIVAE